MTTATGADALQERTRSVVGPVVRKLWNISTEGFDRLPDAGPAILCPNHISFIDSLFLMISVPRNVSFVGKAEYMDDWKTKFLFPAMGMIPIDRSGGSKSQAALDTAQRVLERGELFAIYPEGTRSRDEFLHKGRTGAARLAIQTGAPIYPVGIIGTDKIQPPEAAMPKLRRSATIKIGRPIKPERYADRTPPHAAYRSMIDEVMYEVSVLSERRYVDSYVGKPIDIKPTEVGSVSETSASATSATADLVGATG